MMNGTIGAHSTPGQGSTFWFELTLPTAAPTPSVPEPSGQLASRGERDEQGNLTDAAPLVLVAEDNPVNQMLAVRLLDKCGYRAEAVSTGLEALTALQQQTYVAILMDCQMPEMDGYEATRQIRLDEQPPAHLPIIALTAHSMPGDRERCLTAGMDDYLSKPLRAPELADVLTRTIQTSHSQAHVDVADC